ncbi:MAG: DUF2809 domain-containing protein [Bacteroidales bacterium]|nr:DUF2809 domain-containing protein [Bacteroidales bacterium]
MKAKNLSQVFNYLILIIVAAVLGILSRSYGSFLPDLIARYAGDTLWAVALYFVIALFSLKRTFSFRFFLTLILSAVDEFSQLYHAPWIDEIRHTTVGALVLGNTFVWTDLLCYLAGATVAVIIDYTFVKTR